MHKKIVSTTKAPAPVGPYSQAVWAGNLLFLSGTNSPLTPTTGDMVLDDIEAETHQVMKNIDAVLKEAGLSFENIVKTSIFLDDMNDFSRVNVVYGSYFNADTAPARECVEVAKLPKGVNVEISVIAFAEVKNLQAILTLSDTPCDLIFTVTVYIPIRLILEYTRNSKKQKLQKEITITMKHP